MSSGAKLKRGSAKATLTTEQQRATNIYAEKKKPKHTHAHARRRKHVRLVTSKKVAATTGKKKRKKRKNPNFSVHLQSAERIARSFARGYVNAHARTHTRTVGGGWADPLVCPHMAAIDR